MSRSVPSASARYTRIAEPALLREDVREPIVRIRVRRREVDRRPMPPKFAEDRLAAGEPSIVPIRRFEGSPEWYACARAVRLAYR